jgi:hypothetical protein
MGKRIALECCRAIAESSRFQGCCASHHSLSALHEILAPPWQPMFGFHNFLHCNIFPAQLPFGKFDAL